MFRVIVLLSLATLVLCLSTGNLKVSVKAATSKVKSIDDIVISAVISNPTDKDIRVIAKNNILDSSLTNSFTVSDKNHKNVLFTGIRATYDLSAEGVYTTIPAGSSVVVNHTGFAALYDFESSGIGTFTFAANTLFQMGPNTPPEVVDTPPVKIEVTHDVQRREQLYRRWSVPVCSDPLKRRTLASSIDDALSLASNAAEDLAIHPGSTEFTTYFGGNSHLELESRMDLIAFDDPARQVYCNSDPAGLCSVSRGVVAYSFTFSSSGTTLISDIFICDLFFTSVGTTPSLCSNGFDDRSSSRGGIILGVLSHATFSTRGNVYGCRASASLPDADKLNNAENYRPSTSVTTADDPEDISV